MPKSKNLFLKIVVIFFIILMCYLIYTKIQMDTDTNKILEEKKAQIFSKVDKNTNVNVTKYYIYGTYFNIEGTLDIIKISGINISQVELVIKTLDGEEIRARF